MAYRNGNPDNNAANLPFKVKSGLALSTERGLTDDAYPNNWAFFGDNAAGTGKVHALYLVDTNNQTNLRNQNGVVAYAINVIAMGTPVAPTITTAGTAGSTAYSYKIVALNGRGASLGSTAASAAGSTALGNATLTTTNYNIVTFPNVTGAAYYTVYRTASSGTPSTTGLIGYVAATIVNGIGSTAGLQPTTYVFNDTGIAGDSSTPPTANTSGGAAAIGVLGTPSGVTATPVGTVGATTDAYKIVAVAANGSTTAASSAGTSTTSNATLSTTNYNTVAWNPVPGAVSYTIYRTTAGGTPSTTGVIGSVLASAFSIGTKPSFNDTGIAGDSTTAPTVNTTGGTSVSGLSTYQLTTPVNVVATPNGTTGATTITYKVVANGIIGTTAASAAGTTTTANATLSATNSVTVTWNAVPGATGYVVYRTAAGGTPSSTGVVSGTAALSPNVLSFVDTGATGDSTTAPTVNTTGGMVTSIADNFLLEAGANNALVATLNDSNGNPVPLVNGLQIMVRLAHSLQAGANTLNFNATGVKSIKLNTNPATDLAVGYSVGGTISLIYDSTNTVWQELS